MLLIRVCRYAGTCMYVSVVHIWGRVSIPIFHYLCLYYEAIRNCDENRGYISLRNNAYDCKVSSLGKKKIIDWNLSTLRVVPTPVR